jgi:DNA invertase Pin-like site-specific DNA recombinase
MNQVLDLFDVRETFSPTPTAKAEAPAKSKVAVYLRVSTEDQNTDLQMSELLAQAKLRDWEPIIYEDQGISGANFDRPALNRLLADADAGRIKVIMAWKLDRIGRSTQHLAGIINQLLRAEVGLVVPSQGIDTSAGSMNPASKLQLNVLAAVAEFERDLIRERTKAGMKAAKARGVRFGRETVVTEAQRVLAKEILQLNPDTSVTSLSKQLKLSLGTASRLKTLIFNSRSRNKYQESEG